MQSVSCLFLQLIHSMDHPNIPDVSYNKNNELVDLNYENTDLFMEIDKLKSEVNALKIENKEKDEKVSFLVYHMWH